MSNTEHPVAWVNGIPTPSPAEFESRRAQLLATLPDNSAVVVLSSPEVLRNGDDNTYTYRQSSDILYLSGFPEASSALVLTKKNGHTRFVMFVSRQDKHSELWHGKRIGLEGAVTLFGADKAHSITTLGGNLRRILARSGCKSGFKHVYFAKGADPKLEAKVEKVLARLKLKVEGSPSETISELRLVKSPAEQIILHQAAKIAAAAHTAAIKACHPGMAECDLKAAIEFVFTANGNACPSYDTIVANGPNGLSLHHPAGIATLEDGHMVLVDAGCEVSGYASDITRTYPVNGRFTTAQKEIYELVLAAQLAAIAAVKPGATWTDLDEACNQVLEPGLKALGFPICKSGKKGLTLGALFPHGLGHWLGLDVHDVGRDKVASKTAKGAPDQRGKKVQRPLVPGMVLTIEPGLYLSLTDKRIPEQYRGIAVRIEDDILVRESAAFVLTSAVVKTVVDIERLMGR
jgi:Xaa-Pro aminopeptidase